MKDDVRGKRMLADFVDLYKTHTAIPTGTNIRTARPTREPIMIPAMDPAADENSHVMKHNND